MKKSFLMCLFVLMLSGTAGAQDALERATAELVSRSVQVDKAANSNQLYELIQIAEKRRSLMVAAMKEHPEQVLKSALSSSQRRRLPAAVKVLTEKSVHVSGRLVTGVADDFDGHKATYLYELTTLDDRKLNLHFANDVGRMFRGDLIEADGIEVGTDVAVKGDLTALSPTSAHARKSLAATTTVEVTQKRVAIILYNFENWPQVPYTAASARAAVFTNPAGANPSASIVYQQMSFGKLSLTGTLDTSNGDVFGWYTIPNSSFPYPANNVDQCGSVASYTAETFAAADGFNRSNYDVIVYGFPMSVCGYSGLGYAGTPGLVYINNSSFTTDLLVHELGHAFGRNHAYALACTDASGARVAISNNCVSVNGGYGDVFDYMGQAGLKGGFNAYEKNNTYTPPWIDSSNIYTITNSSQAGDYTLSSNESPSGVLVVRIARGDGNYYYLELRQKAPGTGILVRLAPDFPQTTNSKLLDTTPGSNPGTGVLDDFLDAQLTTGRTFNDPAFGISFTVTSITPDASAATVHVSFDSTVCATTAPSLVTTPLSQTGTARQTFTYQVSLRNKDITACYGSTYNIKISTPLKWSGVPASFSESLMPGDTVTREFTVAPPSSTKNGTYSITTNAVNSVKKNKSASSQATVVID